MVRRKAVVAATAVAAAAVALVFGAATAVQAADLPPHTIQVIPNPGPDNPPIPFDTGCKTLNERQFLDEEYDQLLGSESGDLSDSGAAGSGTVSGSTLDVSINAGYVVVAILVKGGNQGSNLYIFDPHVSGPADLEGLTTPSGQAISHWFVCGYEDETPPSTSPPASEPPSSEPPTTEPPATETTKTNEPGLPVTGASLGGLIAAGVALVAGGVGLLLWRRRRDITDAGAAS